MPRIIAGKAKGTIIDTPAGMQIRPTSDRAKEALFNILRDSIENRKVLDLFSGTGSLGLEAVSRGAVSCLFVDNNKNSINIIERNISKCHFENQCEIICAGVEKALGMLGRKKSKFGCIFMDPPYGKKLLKSTIEKIGENDIIVDGSIIIVEHEKNEMPPEETDVFKCYDRRRYGAVNFSFYKVKIKRPVDVTLVR